MKPTANKSIILSASIIAGNEENWIGAILKDCQKFADEIVVFCSGTDRTKAICLEHGARVFTIKWVNNFSVARNACLKECRGRYIIWLDADDRVIPSQQQRIKELKDNYLHRPKNQFYQCMLCDKKGNAPAHFLSQLRIFPKIAENMWEGAVHETVATFAGQQGYVPRETDIWIYHEGYQDQKVLDAKIKRNIELLMSDLQEKESPLKQSYLGASLSNMGDTENAMKIMAEAFDKFEKSTHKPSKFTYIMRLFPILLKEKKYPELWGAMELAKKVYPKDPQPYAVQARVAAIAKKWPLCLELIDKGLTLDYEEDAGLPVIGDVHNELKILRKMVETETAYDYAKAVQTTSQNLLKELV